jgi:hypothetical protein
MYGRAEARAPQGDVRIALHARRDSAEPERAPIRPARASVEPISNVAADDDETDEDASGGADMVNAEDLEPPASEAASLAPSLGRERQDTLESPDGRPAPLRAGWNVRPRASAGRVPRNAASENRSSQTDVGPEPSGAASAGSKPEDDGPNPLPPAIERDTDHAALSSDPTDDSSPRIARREMIPESSAPIVVKDSTGARNIWPDGRGAALGGLLPSTAGSRAERPAPFRTPAPDSSGPGDQSSTIDAPIQSAPSLASHRPTWGEIMSKESRVPLDESVRLAVHDEAPRQRRVVTLTSTSSSAKPARSWLLGGRRAQTDAPRSDGLCRIDPVEHKLVDFQLPGLDGRMVALGDIDADLILLDFWGSWCKECRKSLPHHKELAGRLAGRHIEVIGVACERGASFQERQASAARAARSLGINYRVLISSMDGTCPVQRGLQVQFYPTMVLVDRHGRVIDREQGATDLTLARLDRAIATALRDQPDR